MNNNSQVQTERQHIKTTCSYKYPSDQETMSIYGNDKYDRIATKVRETTNYIERLKKIKKGLSRNKC